MVRKPPPGPEDDKRLWKLVASTVTPRAPGKPEKMRSKARIRPVKSDTAIPVEQPTHLASIAPLRVSPEELKPAPAKVLKGPVHHIEPNRKRRIVKEHDPIGARLDMHGLDQDRARATLEGFIRRAYDDGHRAVLVITGKGRVGHGVLKQRTPEWLAGPALREMIAGVSTADQRHGGDGALYVALKRKG
ncbi:Smr/MutS family protein [Caulobacter sp. 602-1]|uniref:Smr/MutS family protein n=1 Tax=Caulobacter sp. 602-1 TaxID=2492472 RepID=UPI000F62C851|nr:Smr/MutS family protein [Caulobacter sp. 602-1]RRN62567.1 DNA mismatch repair protein MutS [Caulobacter sp. 602-1]